MPSSRRRPRPLMIAAAAVLTVAGLGAAVGVAYGPVRDWSRSQSVEVALPAPEPAPSGPGDPSATGSRPSTAPSATPVSPPTSAGTGELIPVNYPRSGPGTWRYAPTAGPVLGGAGPIRRFQVAVESNLAAIDMNQLTAKIDQTLGDPRSWVAGGGLRLQRVPGGAPHEFTIYLATEQTSTAMCAAGGSGDTAGYTSCRTVGRVIINLDRWYQSVPEYVQAGVSLDTYRSYLINHETGHELGHGHVLCPGRGRPAPVMEQQTLGLHGCTPNAWPYLSGHLNTGPPGTY